MLFMFFYLWAAERKWCKLKDPTDLGLYSINPSLSSLLMSLLLKWLSTTTKIPFLWLSHALQNILISS